jgi:uncharacterized protein
MLIKVDRSVPLIGALPFGIIDRGTNLIQVRATSVCNINCTFCSVDGGIKSTLHKNFFEVDCDYLIEQVNKVVKFKEESIEINIDSVGEPFCYPHLEKIVEGFRGNSNIRKISIQTNGTIFRNINVDVINLSLHAMDDNLAKELADSKCFSMQKLIDNAKKWTDSGVKVRLCPVWLPGVNDEEIPKIIQFAKNNGYELGIQKYEVYKYSRKVRKVKPLNWYKFYKQIENWEKEFGVVLKVKAKDLGVSKAKRIPEVFKKGEKVHATIILPGWFEDQKIAVAKNRCISVKDCDKNIGDMVSIKILETNNNIYLAE